MFDYTNITPKMTSNNAPAPYSVSSSSVYSDSYSPYLAFDNNINSTADAGWVTVSGKNIDEYIEFDFSSKVNVGRVKIYRYYPNPVTSVLIEGSNDGTTWSNIKLVSDITYTADEDNSTHLSCDIIFGKIENYSKYRLTVKGVASTSSYTGFNEIKFYKAIPKDKHDVQIKIKKLLQENMPESSNEESLYFTEDGGIYITSMEGELIKCGGDGHEHINKTVIDSLTDEDGILTYEGKPLASNTDVHEHNNKEVVDKFSEDSGKILFDGKELLNSITLTERQW